MNPHDERANMKHVWWVFLAIGIVSILVGLAAISATFVATMASVMVIGILLMIAGAAEVIHAVMVRHGSDFALHLLAAALYLLVGLFMLEDPIKAATVITLLLAAAFFVGGVLRVLFAVLLRFEAWKWVALTGVINLILGLMILNDWPEASVWVIGLFVGIDLVLHGWSWVALGLIVRTGAAPRSTLV